MLSCILCAGMTASVDVYTGLNRVSCLGQLFEGRPDHDLVRNDSSPLSTHTHPGCSRRDAVMGSGAVLCLSRGCGVKPITISSHAIQMSTANPA